MGVAGMNRHLEIFVRVYVTLSSIVQQDHSRAREVHGVGFWKERLQVFQKRTDILEI